MQSTHTTAEAMTAKDHRIKELLETISTLRQATIEDHIIVDRGFTCASIYMVQANGEKFMVVRPKKHEFSDSKGKRYTFMEVTK